MTDWRLLQIAVLCALLCLATCSCDSERVQPHGGISANRNSPSNKNVVAESTAPPNSSEDESEPPAVRFNIQELARQKVSGGEEVTWLATHESTAGIARFRISLTLEDPPSGSPFAPSKCALIREGDSQSSGFLQELAGALGANGNIKKRAPADRLDFDVVLLGQNVNRTPQGGFSGDNGDWIVTKVFVGQDEGPESEGEFYLNLNPRVGIGVRGFLFDPAANNFIPDDGSARVTDGALRALAATAGQEVTYTAAPPGSGSRVAFNR